MRVRIVSVIASDIGELAKRLEEEINKVLSETKKVKDVKVNIVQDPFYRGYCALAVIFIEE